MAFSNNQAIISKKASFNEVVDDVCDRLIEQQAQYSIRRIHEMEEKLNLLEQELNAFLSRK